MEMSCKQIEKTGLYVDDEMSVMERRDFESHIEHCSACAAEFGDLSKLADGIATTGDMRVPDALWSAIEQRLHETGPPKPPARKWRRFRLPGGPWAMAALIALAIGLGTFGLSSLESSARASTIDYAVLLDSLPLDPRKACGEFVARHDGTPTTAIEAKRIASNLNFETPAVLPGNFRLQSVHRLKIGRAKGIAAAYDRNGEFLAVVFHPPVKREEFGSHKNFPCVIGEHCGHKVQIGEWKLVHLTDPTTCHCLLSRLDEQTEMPAVMSAIVPEFVGGGDDHGH